MTGGKRIVWLLALILLSACTDDENDIRSIERMSFYVWSAACGDHSISINAMSKWTLTTEAGWLYIPKALRNGQGVSRANIYVEQNSSSEQRKAIIVLEEDGKETQRIEITQLGLDEGDSNALFTDSIKKDYAVGWGYNAFGEYASLSDVKAQIINYKKLLDVQSDLQEDFINDNVEYELNYSKETAHSMSEFSKNITKESNSKSNILFYKKEVNKRTSTTTTTKDECSFATLSVLNVVAQRHMSESALKTLLGRGKDILTKDFKDKIEDVKAGRMSAKSFIDLFGTDVVLAAWLGGRLDYTTTIKKTTTTEIEKVVTTTYKKLFKKSSSMTEEENRFSEKIGIDYDCTCFVKGGKTAGLQNEINLKLK